VIKLYGKKKSQINWQHNLHYTNLEENIRQIAIVTIKKIILYCCSNHPMLVCKQATGWALLSALKWLKTIVGTDDTPKFCQHVSWV